MPSRRALRRRVRNAGKNDSKTKTKKAPKASTTKQSAAERKLRKKVENFLSDVSDEVERRKAKILAEGDVLSEKIRRELRVELLKLPLRIRSMPLKEFIEKHGGDRDEALANKARSDAQGGVVTGTVRKARGDISFFRKNKKRSNHVGKSKGNSDYNVF